MLDTSPLYGRFDLDEHTQISVILDRLKLVAQSFLNEAPFSAYLITEQGSKFYGLDYEEILSLYPLHKKELKTFSASAISTGFIHHRSLRLHLRYDHPSAFVKGQYIISAGNRWRNQAIEKMIKGVWTTDMMKQEEEDELPVSKNKSEKELPLQTQWDVLESFSPRHKPIIRMVDTFYFDKNVSVYTLLNLLDELSIQYLNDTPFHAQLDTTDGDFYFNIDSQELRYMFTCRRHTLLTLYLDAIPVQGQWLSLMLSFHPLATGPNAEIEIAATESDGITSLIWETLVVEAQANQREEINEVFAFDPKLISLEKIIASVNYIRATYLHQIPPIAFLSTINGSSYAGLSFYQLRKVFRRLEDQTQILSIGVNRIMTGQNMSLTFKFQHESKPPTASLSLLWGEPSLHQKIRDQLSQQLLLSSLGQASTAEFIAISYSPLVKAEDTPIDCLLALPLEADWSQQVWQSLLKDLRERGVNCKQAGSFYEWDDQKSVSKNLTDTAVIVADITHQHPDVFYTIGMARTMGKEIIIIAQQMRDIPADLRQFRCVIYHLNSISSGKLALQLARLITE